jgi:hypothetical protein
MYWVRIVFHNCSFIDYGAKIALFLEPATFRQSR